MKLVKVVNGYSRENMTFYFVKYIFFVLLSKNTTSTVPFTQHALFGG